MQTALPQLPFALEEHAWVPHVLALSHCPGGEMTPPTLAEQAALLQAPSLQLELNTQAAKWQTMSSQYAFSSGLPSTMARIFNSFCANVALRA